MATAEFSAMYVRNPVKAARHLAEKRRRIAQLEAGAPARTHESIAEHRRVAERLELAFRETKRCEDCGHPLEDPDSVRRGWGPDCDKRRRATAADAALLHAAGAGGGTVDAGATGVSPAPTAPPHLDLDADRDAF